MTRYQSVGAAGSFGRPQHSALRGASARIPETRVHQFNERGSALNVTVEQ